MKTVRVAMCVVLAIVAYGIVGYADYQDAVDSEVEYCVKVGEGTWPDYRKEVDGKDYLEKCFKK